MLLITLYISNSQHNEISSPPSARRGSFITIFSQVEIRKVSGMLYFNKGRY